MEKKEYSLNEVFENQVLNQLYESSGDSFQGLYIRMYGKPTETKEEEQAKEKLQNLMNEFVKDKEKQKELWIALDRYSCCKTGESNFWNKQYYKLGFLDKIYLKKEVEDTRNLYLRDLKDNDAEKNNFLYQCRDSIIEYLYNQSVNSWKKREDYKELMEKISVINAEYPNVRMFLEDNKITILNEDELEALREYIILNRGIEIIEMLESFRLGLKEGNLL